MRNKIIFTALFVASLGLTACGNNGSNTNKSGWSSDDENLMKEHLHGEVLPYLDKEGITVEWDDYYEQILITNGTFAEGELKSYVDLFTTKNGWVTEDISEYNYLDEGTVYEMTKWVDTSEGSRFVDVIATAYNVITDEDDPDMTYTEYSSVGTVLIQAYDPYYYEFPSEIAQMFAYFSSNDDYIDIDDVIIPPAFDAEYYGINTNYYGIYCFLGDRTIGNSTGYVIVDDAGYSDILNEAGWTILEEKDDDGYYVAISPDETYQIAYLYDSEYNDLDIYFEYYDKPIISNEWDEEIIENLFDYYGANYFSIPALDVEGATYHYVRDEDNIWYIIDDEEEEVNIGVEVYPSAEDDFTNYLTTLEENEWNVTKDESNSSASAVKEVETNKEARLEVSYADGMVYVKIYLYLHVTPFTEWPAELINKNIKGWYGDDADELPAFVGDNNGFYVDGNVISVLVDDVDEAIASYQNTLTNQDPTWTVETEEDWSGEVSETGFYISPNEDYRVTIYEDWEYSDRVIIYVSDIPEPIITYDEFPSEVLASLLGEDITDAIPALTGADSYTITCVTSTDGTDIYGEVQCTFRDYDNTDIEEIVNNYNNVTLAGWETYYDGDGDPTDYKKSPNNQIAVRAEYDDYEEYYVVTIYFDNIVDGLI